MIREVEGIFARPVQVIREVEGILRGQGEGLRSGVGEHGHQSVMFILSLVPQGRV